MKKNVGKTDKTIRIILGVLIGAAGIYFSTWWGLIGLIPLLTGILVHVVCIACLVLVHVRLKPQKNKIR